MIEYRFIIPIERNTDRGDHTPEVIVDFENSLLELAGGFTDYGYVRGLWKDKNSKVIRDIGRHYGVSINEDLRPHLIDLLVRACNMFDQTCIYLVDNTGNADLVYAEVKETLNRPKLEQQFSQWKRFTRSLNLPSRGQHSDVHPGLQEESIGELYPWSIMGIGHGPDWQAINLITGEKGTRFQDIKGTDGMFEITGELQQDGYKMAEAEAQKFIQKATGKTHE